MLTLFIDNDIQGESRELLREVACGSYPHILLTANSEYESETWTFERGNTNTKLQQEEIEILAHAFSQSWDLIRHEDNWTVKPRNPQ